LSRKEGRHYGNYSML